MKILDIAVFVGCILSLALALISSNWSGACGWFVGTIGYGRLTFER